MTYNKREVQAIGTLEKILKALQQEKRLELSTAEANSLAECLGWNLRETTYLKKEVKTWVRGKEQVLVEIAPPVSSWTKIANFYCFFPFQVKEQKESQS